MANHPNRSRAIIHATSLDRWPGDTACKLTRAAVDSTGRRHPAGTIFQPLSFGIDNGAPGWPEYRAVSISGERVTFYGPPRHQP